MGEISIFHNKKIAILWYGREGTSSLHFLLNIGVSPRDITILDWANQIEWLATNLENIAQSLWMYPEFNIILGETYLDYLKQFDIIIKTPGISLYHPKVFPFRKKITSQAQIFFDWYQGKIIAISGTKGKSTTATLTYETLKNAGKNVILIGNIGNPVLDYLDTYNLQSQKEQYAVFEVSSYMLEWLTKKNYISVLLNIYPDHLDRHQWFDNYQKAKFNILYGSEHNVLRYEIIKTNELEGEDFKGFNVHIFGKEGEYTYKDGDFFLQQKKIADDKNILLRGEHNMINICAVVWICDIMHIDYKILYTTLATFSGLPHRMENIWIYWWITWIDDAISTTPESTIQAIKTFGKDIDTIFLWWTDRWYVFDELAKKIVEYKIRNVVLFPDSGKKIFDAIKKNDNGEIKIFQTRDMQEAVKFAYKYTKTGKICLLSTASPSYSIRKNFEEKGNVFKQYIQEV